MILFPEIVIIFRGDLFLAFNNSEDEKFYISANPTKLKEALKIIEKEQFINEMIFLFNKLVIKIKHTFCELI